MKIIRAKFQTVFACLAVAIVFCGCAQSYPTEIYDVTKDPSVVNEEGKTTSNTIPIQVFVNEQSFFTLSASPNTRGTGTFDKEENKATRFWNAQFHVFAFRKGRYASSPIAGLKDDADLSRSAYSSTNKDTEMIDCLMDDENYWQGVPMRVNFQGSGELKRLEDGESVPTDLFDLARLPARQYFYSTVHQDIPYNFFCYYMDDFEPNAENTHRTRDSIYYDFSIDGSQDIMCGMAPDLERLLKSGERYSDIMNKLTREEQNKLINIGGYCAYAAHRGIHPQFELDHMLTRLTFEAYPGDMTADDITITGIEVIGKYRGRFVVASNDTSRIGLHFEQDRKGLYLREASADGKEKCQPLNEYSVSYDPSTKGLHWTERTPTRIGESLMLAPDSQYVVRLHYNQRVRGNYSTGAGDTYIPTHSDYVISAPNTDVNRIPGTNSFMFKPGHVYPIRIAVFGRQEIVVTASVAHWIKVPDPIDLHPDDE